MIEFITSFNGFVLLFLLLIIGATGSLVFRKHDSWANYWNSFFSIISSLWGLIFSVFVFIGSRNLFFSFKNPFFSIFNISFSVDSLAAFFIFVISLIALFCSIYGIGYLKHFYKKYDIGFFGFFYNLFIVGMLLVVTASNGIFFLIAWEIMSVCSYFLVVYDHHDINNVKAGFLYLVMTHIGTSFIIIAFLLLYKFTGSFEYESIRSASLFIPVYIKNLVFLSAFIGFGIKAGVIPFHIWLPSAHPAAPSHVSGLMSGVMIKVGIYMMIRFFLYLLQPIPAWWGLVLLIIGSISAVLGVLYALTEHDIKRLLAYHSIENIGIILLGLGGSLTFLSLGYPNLSLLSLTAALFHTINHAIFKSLLFLSAGSVINQTHTRNMEKYGGLIKYMPQTAIFFLIGSMAISALPPFNGFFSEWLTFQSLFQGIALLDYTAKWIFVISAGALAFTGGLALACFVKAFGLTFLARPRSKEVFLAKESSFSLRFGMGALAILSLLFGIFSGYVSSIIKKIGQDLGLTYNNFSFSNISFHQDLSINNFSFVSGSKVFVLLLGIFVVVWVIIRYIINKNQKITRGDTWDCGTNLKPRMEITATGFARSIITIFKKVLKPSIQQEIEYHDVDSRYLTKSRKVILTVSDIPQDYFYDPFAKIIVIFSRYVANIQSGNINTYILYIFITLLGLLFFVK